MFPHLPDKRARILAAAVARISQYGYRRTSMEDIATEAGISRAALYLEFRNKEEILRTAAQLLQEAALEKAGTAADAGLPFDERLRAVIEAKTLGVMEIAFSSPHGAEILDETNRLCGDIVGDAHQRFTAMLIGIFEAATAEGEIDPLRAGLQPAAAAALLLKSVGGLKSRETTVPEFRANLAALVRVFVAGMSAANIDGRDTAASGA